MSSAPQGTPAPGGAQVGASVGAGRAPSRAPLLVVCKPELVRSDFNRLGALLGAKDEELRWTRRAGRLVLLLETPPAEPAVLAALLADPAVDYVLSDPTREELARIFSRRDLLKLALTTTGLMAAAVTAGPLALYLKAPAAQRARHGDVFVGRLENIPVNGSISRVIDGEEFVIVRRDETNLHALSATCTHSNVCLVKWDRGRQQLVCPCHRGIFDLYGNVVSGPPPRPLASRAVVVQAGDVYVKGTAS